MDTVPPATTASAPSTASNSENPEIENFANAIVSSIISGQIQTPPTTSAASASGPAPSSGIFIENVGLFLSSYCFILIVLVRMFSQWFFFASNEVIITSARSKFGDVTLECDDLIAACDVW